MSWNFNSTVGIFEVQDETKKKTFVCFISTKIYLIDGKFESATDSCQIALKRKYEQRMRIVKSRIESNRIHAHTLTTCIELSDYALRQCRKTELSHFVAKYIVPPKTKTIANEIHIYGNGYHELIFGPTANYQYICF